MPCVSSSTTASVAGLLHHDAIVEGGGGGGAGAGRESHRCPMCHLTLDNTSTKGRENGIHVCVTTV